jgi:hypothetical protein
MQTEVKMPKVTEQEQKHDQQFLKQMGITTSKLVYAEHVSGDQRQLFVSFVLPHSGMLPNLSSRNVTEPNGNPGSLRWLSRKEAR